MNARRSSNWRTSVRIIWAITAKDILEAWKNRQAIAVVITALFIAVMYSYMPKLTALDNPTNVLIYDASNTGIGAQLKESQVLEVYTYPSEEMMLEKLAHGEVPELGLIIPADFEEAGAALRGYVLYWVSDEETAKLTQEVEAEITRLAGRPVQIEVADERLIPSVGQSSRGNWIAAALVFIVLYTSLGLISNLMLEEKQTRTLEALLVSPASSWHIVMAKSLTGLVYCLLGVAVTLAINQDIILHWWLIIPALMIGALFSISLGLIAGSQVEERGQLSLWTFGVLIPLFIPVFLSMMDELFPQWVNRVIYWIPSVTMAQLIQASISVLPLASTLLVQFAWLAAWAGAGLVVAVLVLRRQQQKEAGEQVVGRRKAGSGLGIGSRQKEMPAAKPQTSGALPELGQGTVSARPASGLRIIQAIATKDIRQSIHNKLILSILLGTALLMVGNALFIRTLSTRIGSTANLTTSGAPLMAFMISVALMTVGVALVPILMVDEKEAHTMEALLVSPARYGQVVTGKALAGAVYCLSAAMVILVSYRFLFIHWKLALLAMLVSTAFVVALGLLLGMISKNSTTIGMWAAVTLLVLIIPAALAGMGVLEQYPRIADVLAYWPSTAIIELFNLAMVVEIPQGAVIGNASIVISAAIALFLLTWWMVRCSDK